MRYEILKLCKSRRYIFLSAALLLGSCLLLFINIKNTAEYYYIHECRQQYLAFLNGEIEGGEAFFYEEEQQKEQTYIANYPAFLEGMRERADQLQSLSVYSADTYVYENLEKTCADYEKLSGIALEEGNNYGILALTGDTYGLFFLLCFLAMQIYELFFAERGKGLLLLLKATKGGHAVLAFKKAVVSCIGAACFALLQGIAAVLLVGWIYGFGDTDRMLQSVPAFRNCAYRITVGQAVLWLLIIHVLIAAVVSALFFLVGACVRNELWAMLILSGTLAAEYFLCPEVNPFYCWNMQKTLGLYRNLNIFGHACGRNAVALVCGGIFVLLAWGTGMYVFHQTCQIRTQSIFERVFWYIRRLLAPVWRNTCLLWFESAKIWIQQKRVWLALLLLLWCVDSVASFAGVQYYKSAELMNYHAYLNDIHGRITPETLEYIEERNAYIQKLYSRLEALGENLSEEGRIIEESLRYELDMHEAAVERLNMQMEALKGRERELSDQYLVDEVLYIEIWSDKNRELLRLCICAIACILFVSGIYSMDEKKGLMPLLSATYRGRGALKRRKLQSGAVGAAVLVLMCESPAVYQYWRVDGFSCMGIQMCDFTNMLYEGGLTLGGFICLCVGVRILFYAAVTYGTMKLAGVVKNELTVCLVGISAVLCAAGIFWILGTDISELLLRLQP
ncbi:MAG: hypothetical protein NC242_06755 [Roseburia sp.]|nr:hypothetical protein [Roseburia sp.]